MIRLAILVMMRDEAALVREHLGLWLPHAWCAVGAVDDRTRDDSARAFLDATAALKRRFLFYYKFAGLGPARTLLIQETLAFDATHALFVDPDWRPLDTPRLDESNKTVFVFRVFDRNQRTERLLDWCFKLDPGVRFKYRWHEVLDLPEHMTYDAQLLDWRVEEVAGADRLSYHAAEHGGSATAKRFEFEIDLLEQDLAEAPDDPRVLYYLGVDYLALAEATSNSSLYEIAHRHLDRHIHLSPVVYQGLASDEMTYVAMLQDAVALHRLERLDDARHQLDLAVKFDPARAEALVLAARVFLSERSYDQALVKAARASRLPIPVRSFYHQQRAYGCDANSVALDAALHLLPSLPDSQCRACPVVDCASCANVAHAERHIDAVLALCDGTDLELAPRSAEDLHAKVACLAHCCHFAECDFFSSDNVAPSSNYSAPSFDAGGHEQNEAPSRLHTVWITAAGVVQS